MASTVLVKDVLWRVSVLLQETTPQFVHWPEQELVPLIDDAQAAIAKYVPSAGSRLDTIRLQTGTRQSIETIPAAECKPGDGSTPAVPVLGTMVLDLIRNMGTNGTTPGRAIRVTDREKLDESVPDWHTRTGAAVLSFMFDPRAPKYFYVAPALSARTWVEILYSAQPVKLPPGGAPGSEVYKFDGASTTTLSLGDENLDDIVNYVVARAHMKDAEWADSSKAAQFASAFLGSLNARVLALTGNNPNLTVLPFSTEPLGRAKT